MKIAKKIKDVIFNNFGLKVLAAVFAILLWFMVVNITDPVQTRNFTVNVQVTNAEVLQDTGEYYTIPEGKTQITFQASAKRSIIEKLSPSDFTASADMNHLDRDKNRIPIDIAATRYSGSVTISTRTYYLPVNIGKQKTGKFVITPLSSGTPADGFAVSSLTAAPNIINVTGPTDIIDSINSVTATVDVDGMNSDASQDVVPVLLDNDGKQVDMTNVMSDVESVQVTASIMSVKTVGIDVKTSGELQSGYQLGDITVDPNEVQVMGSSDVLNALSTITIPPTVIDLSELTTDFTTTVDISSYLPSGVTLVNSSDSKVKITVNVLSKTEKQLDIPTKNITIQNLGKNLTASFDNDTIPVTISAFGSDLSELDSSTITGIVDASGLKAGDHTVNVTLNLSDEYTVTDTVTTGITIKKE